MTCTRAYVRAQASCQGHSSHRGCEHAHMQMHNAHICMHESMPFHGGFHISVCVRAYCDARWIQCVAHHGPTWKIPQLTCSKRRFVAGYGVALLMQLFAKPVIEWAPKTSLQDWEKDDDIKTQRDVPFIKSHIACENNGLHGYVQITWCEMVKAFADLEARE